VFGGLSDKRVITRFITPVALVSISTYINPIVAVAWVGVIGASAGGNSAMVVISRSNPLNGPTRGASRKRIVRLVALKRAATRQQR